MWLFPAAVVSFMTGNPKQLNMLKSSTAVCIFDAVAVYDIQGQFDMQLYLTAVRSLLFLAVLDSRTRFNTI